MLIFAPLLIMANTNAPLYLYKQYYYDQNASSLSFKKISQKDRNLLPFVPSNASHIKYVKVTNTNTILLIKNNKIKAVNIPKGNVGSNFKSLITPKYKFLGASIVVMSRLRGLIGKNTYTDLNTLQKAYTNAVLKNKSPYNFIVTSLVAKNKNNAQKLLIIHTTEWKKHNCIKCDYIDKSAEIQKTKINAIYIYTK